MARPYTDDLLEKFLSAYEAGNIGLKKLLAITTRSWLETGRSARRAIISNTLQRGPTRPVKQNNPPPNNGTLQPKSSSKSGTRSQRTIDYSLPRPVPLPVSYFYPSPGFSGSIHLPDPARSRLKRRRHNLST